MVTLTDACLNAPTQGRLSLQVAEIAVNSTVFRCQDWDRDRFDIEFELRNGTTYNSFLIRGDRTALIDTTHAKFRELYLAELQRRVDFTTLDYLVVNHTEPDHSGLVAEVLDRAPQITVVGSKVAIQFLQQQIHRPFSAQVVKSGDHLDLGQGHELAFISAPNLHWPDTMLTYDSGTQVLYTCDVLGMHYCDDSLYDDVPSRLDADFQLYYDCLMGPNARSVLGALKRIEPLTIQQVATGHGPLLRHHVAHWRECYRTWSETQAEETPFVALFYTADYGHSERLAQALGQGVLKTGLAVELVDFLDTDMATVRELATSAAGLVVGMPPQDRPELAPLLSTLLAAAHPGQRVGLFETGGGQDEPVFPLRNRCKALDLEMGFEPILIKADPTAATDKLCEEAGTDLGQRVLAATAKRRRPTAKPLADDLDQALGRLSTGLYLLTAQRGDVAGAMLASWVMQTGYYPPGVAIAVAKDRAIEPLLHRGDTFVLNVLEDGHSQRLIKHFLKRFAPGANRFAGIATRRAENGSPILADALAYLECTVTHRLEAHDHWIICATARAGRVANANGLTAIHHRTSGSHY